MKLDLKKAASTALIGFLLVGILASVNAIAPAKSLWKHSFFIVSGLIFCWITTAKWWSTDRCFWALRILLFISFILSLYGIYQFLEYIFAGTWNTGIRITSFTKNPNSLAKFLLPFIPVACILAIDSKKLLTKNYYFAVTLAMIIALIVTQSRGAWGALIVSLVLIAYLMRSIKSALWICIPLFAGLAILPGNAAIARIKTIFDWTLLSNAERLHIWDAALKMIKNNPLIGIGLNHYELHYPSYKSPSGYFETFGHAHNTFINIAVETGLLGAILFMAFLLIILYRIFKENNLDNYAGGISIGLGIGTISTLFYGLVEYNFNNELQILLFFVLLGLAERITCDNKDILNRQCKVDNRNICRVTNK